MKLLHAADLHLDSPFERLPPEKSAARRRELRTLPTQMARLVKSERADLVLLPGDLLDGDRVYPETVRALAQALEKMAVPVFIARGTTTITTTAPPMPQRSGRTMYIFSPRPRCGRWPCPR